MTVPSWYERLGASKRERLVWPHCACGTWAGKRMRGVRCVLCGGGPRGGGTGDRGGRRVHVRCSEALAGDRCTGRPEPRRG